MRVRVGTFLSGAVAALVIEGLAAVLVIVSGVVDVAAVRSGGVQDRILAYASTRSVARHAPAGANPVAGDPAAVRTGLRAYASSCVACHGAPGVDPARFAAGLHPAAPDLSSPEVQSFSDGMLYQAISGGIASTGMPAFGPGRSTTEIWRIAAFVRHLPALTADERHELQELSATRAGVTAAAPRGEAQPAPAAPGHAIRHVTISGFRFEPPDVEAHAGDTVEWKNADFAAHTATAVDGAFDTGRIDPGEVKRVVVRDRGRFPYFCRYHLSMKGTVTVR